MARPETMGKKKYMSFQDLGGGINGQEERKTYNLLVKEMRTLICCICRFDSILNT
jgi:hypothetical protein